MLVPAGTRLSQSVVRNLPERVYATSESLEHLRLEKVVGEVFGIEAAGETGDHRAISREYITKTLPGKYVNSGVTRGVKHVLRRLLRFRGNSRLLPAGIGLGVSALTAYETVVSVGQATLKNLPRLLQGDAGGEPGA